MPELIRLPLPYARDSSELIRYIGALPGAVCLDSGLGDQIEGRYDILTALPSRELRLRYTSTGHGIEYRESNTTAWQPVHHYHDIFAAADALLRDNPPDSQALEPLQDLPFCGGVIACLAYDAAAPVARTGQNPTGDTTALDTPAPDTEVALSDILRQVPLAMCGLYQWAVIVDHQQKSTVMFVLPQCPADIRQQLDTVFGSSPEAGAGAACQDSNDFKLLEQGFVAQMNPAAYGEAFQRLKEWIYAGDCYQANLAIPFVARFHGDPLNAYLRLRQGSRSPFSAWVNHDEIRVLGLSPERFISVVDRQVMTQPIKGTRKRSAHPEQDKQLSEELLASEKDRAENLMIVDLLRNDLGSICETGSVKTEALFQLHSFTQVHHLISTVTGRLPVGVSPLALLRQCFPGGSITGAPKIRAMEIIAELEPLPRSVYCGSVMYCDYRGRMDSNISIRTLLCTRQHIFCWGGGGIVADSEVEREHQEACDKVSALMHLVSAP